MKVREATLADLPATTEIYNHEVATSTSTFDMQPRDERSAREWFDAHQTPAFPLIVAEEDGEIVAWATLTPWSPRGAYRYTVEASLFVREGHRGTGVGTLMTRELVSRAESAGHHVVLARVEASNRPSRKVLLNLGFSSVGVLHEAGRKFDRWLDSETFELVIDPGVAPARGGG